MTSCSVGIGRGCSFDKKGGNSGGRSIATCVERHDLPYTASDNATRVQSRLDETDEKRDRFV